MRFVIVPAEHKPTLGKLVKKENDTRKNELGAVVQNLDFHMKKTWINHPANPDAVRKCAHLVDLENAAKMKTYLQTSASIQPRTSLLKFGCGVPAVDKTRN